MRVMTLVSHRAGSGRSTLAAHMAVHAERSGISACVLDTTPAGELAAWRDRRQDGTLAIIACPAAEAADRLTALRDSGTELAIIDTGDALDDRLQQIVDLSDLLIIPAEPEREALAGMHPIVDFAERSGVPFFFVFNGVSSDTTLSGEAAMALAQFGTVAAVSIRQDDRIADAMAAGGTVLDAVPDCDAAGDFRAFAQYCGQRLDKLDSIAESPALDGEDVANQRRFPRLPFAGAASLDIDGVEHVGELANISAGGAALNADCLPDVGAHGFLTVPGLGTYPVQVRHTARGVIGVQFLITAKAQWHLIKRLTELVPARTAERTLNRVA